ncbi:Trehalose-6-P synthase/phosphatase complex subunit [Fusarium falciforme]|nr:Trehalose-6-P synthase/phosphatase complex subunit [Fusarium falciforme]
MTVFVCSLFLPKTIHFTLPGTPPPGADPSRRSKPAKSSNAAASSSSRPQPLTRQPSLFQTQDDLTPPHTPTEDPDSPNLFANEDGFRIQFPHAVNSPEGQDSRTWGSRSNQPKSRANSPPPQPSPNTAVRYKRPESSAARACYSPGLLPGATATIESLRRQTGWW